MRSLNKTLETEVKSALRRGGNDTLNIYFMDATPYLGAPQTWTGGDESYKYTAFTCMPDWLQSSTGRFQADLLEPELFSHCS